MTVSDAICVCLGGCDVWTRVGRPCPPVCDEIVAPRYLIFNAKAKAIVYVHILVGGGVFDPPTHG